MQYACYEIRVPEDSMELVRKVPKDWNVLDHAYLTYEGTKKHNGIMLYSDNDSAWHRKASLEDVFKGEIFVPSEINFLRHADNEFLANAKNKLLPEFVENGYRLRRFTAEWANLFHPYNKIAGIHFYEEREPCTFKWTGKWSAIIYSEDLMKSIKVYKKYITKRSV